MSTTITHARIGSAILAAVLAVQPLMAQAANRATQPATPNAGFTISVNTFADEWSTDTATQAQSKCSLREALQATGSASLGNQGCGAPSISNFSDYTINMPAGTYVLTRPEQMPNTGKNIFIDGKGGVTIDGGSKSGRIDGIFIVAAGDFILNKLKLQYGQRPFGGAIWIKGGDATVRVTEVEFYRNLSDNGSGNGDGGAVAVDVGNFYCVKSKFIENTARNAGGAVSSGGAQVLMDRCEFIRNHAGLNGGAYAGYAGSEVTHPILRDVIFRENWVYQLTVPATWPGQYAYTDDSSGGGALYNKGYMELERVQFIKNYTDRSKGGGAIYNQGELRMLDVAITDSKAKAGGPVPATFGGAILNDSTMIARRVSIHYNEATRAGGIMNRLSGTLYFVNSTMAENLAKSGGGLSNGYSFQLNGQQVSQDGGTVHLYHATLVRANDDKAESVSIENIGNGYIYMANSVTDSLCTGTINSHGGNVFKTFCNRVSTDINVDLTQTDVVVENVGDIGLQGLADNGGAPLSEAEFLSVKLDGNSPAVDLGRDAYCTDPALVPLFLMDKDQLQGARLQGQHCDSGAVEVGSLPPQFDSDQPEGAGFHFPLTVFGKVWESSQTLRIENKGGGLIQWEVQIENSVGGVFSLVGDQTSGGLGRNQSTTLTFKCQPQSIGWADGMILIKTDLPSKKEIRYPVSCKMITNPEAPSTYRSQPPGPISTGKATPNGATDVQLRIGNQGANPMGATISWKDAVADTIKFTAAPGMQVMRSELAKPSTAFADYTIPPSGTLALDITCTPPAPGLYANTLQIQTDDPDDPLLEYNVSCEGISPPDPEPINNGVVHTESPTRRVMGMALSPDDKQLLAGHWDDANLAIYSISDPALGNLSYQGLFSATGMSTITGIRYSSDGKQVYYSSNGGDGVVVANRATNGALSLSQVITTGTPLLCGINPLKFCPINAMNGARSLDISSDDMNVYVTGANDGTLTVLNRNAGTGKLSVGQVFTAMLDGSAIMTNPFGVRVSPDGGNVYVAAQGGDAVIAFKRNPNDGSLRYLMHVADETNGATGLNGATEIALSPDGKFLYATSTIDDAVQIFARNPSDGYLTPTEVVAMGNNPYHIITSHDPDGSRVIVAEWLSDTIKVFNRDRVTGMLTPLADQVTLTKDGPVYLVSTPDDLHIYAALFDGVGVQHMRSLKHTPVVQSLSPASVPAGSADFTLTINGSRFYSTSVVMWNGAPLATTFVDDRQLQAQVPAANVAAAGSVAMFVRTPPSGGGDSNTVNLSIQAPNAVPIPSVESLSPSEATFGGEPLNVVINGAGFIPTSKAFLNGAAVDTTYINPNMLLVQLSASEVGAAGPLAITVSNDGAVVANTFAVAKANANTSFAARFAVAAPGAAALPSVSQFQPGSIRAGSGEQWLTVVGANFSTAAGAATVAKWNGAVRETVVLDENKLQMHLSADDVLNASQNDVTAYTPGVGESTPLSFGVLAAGQNPIAQISTVQVQLDPAPQLVIAGSDFVDGAVVRFNGAVRGNTQLNDAVLIATMSMADLSGGGVVQVTNPGTGASKSVVVAPTRFVFLPMQMK